MTKKTVLLIHGTLQVSEPQGAEDQALVRGRLVLPMKDPEIYT